MYENWLKSMKIIRGAPCEMYENHRKSMNILRGPLYKMYGNRLEPMRILRGTPQMFENRWKSMEVMCAVHCNPRPLKGSTAAKFLRTPALSSGSLKVGPKSSVSRSTLLRSDFHESSFH